MKHFLAKFTIYDGEHEHSGNFVVKAENLDEAEKMAKAQEHDTESEDNGNYWNYGDGTTASELQSVQEITEKEAEILNRLGVAYSL